MILASILALSVAAAPTGDPAPAASASASDVTPAPEARPILAPLHSDLRDPFAHLPRRSPAPQTAPPNDLKDPFKTSAGPRPAGTGGEPTSTTTPTTTGDLIDPFSTGGARQELQSSALKDPFTTRQPRTSAPSPSTAPIQRPAQESARRAPATQTPAPTILPPSQ